MRVQWQHLGLGDVGIAQTARAMRAAVDRAQLDPRVVQTARGILAGSGSKDPRDWIARIVAWVNARFRFVKDPVRYELIAGPSYLLEQLRRTAAAGANQGRGYFQEDCDGASTMVCALAESVGIPCRFRIISRVAPFRGDSGFSHVIAELDAGNEHWISYDATRPDRPLGWAPPLTGRQATYGRTSGMQYRFNGYLAEDVAPQEPGIAYTPTILMTTTWPPPVTQSDNPFDPDVIPQYLPPLTWPATPEAPNPAISETAAVVISPAGTPGTARQPAGPGSSGIFADIAAGVSKILVPIGQVTLPLLERYGVLRPVAGTGQPRRLPLPGETQAGYLASLGYLPRGTSIFPTTFAGWLPWLLVGGVVLYVVSGPRRPRGDARNPRHRRARARH